MAAPHNYLAVIKVVGIGGGGVNAVNRMIEAGLRGVEFIAMNTDAQAPVSDADVKLDVGGSSPGPGCRVNPNAAAKPPRIPRGDRGGARGADMVFIAAGIGGGTGTGAAPVIAQISRDSGHSPSAW